MKRTNKKGFTLAELLIVVAIIAVLVAIAIPVFGSELKKAHDAVDVANVRAAYAEIMTAKIVDGNAAKTVTVDFQGDGSTTTWTDAKIGTLELGASGETNAHPGSGSHTVGITWSGDTPSSFTFS